MPSNLMRYLGSALFGKTMVGDPQRSSNDQNHLINGIGTSGARVPTTGPAEHYVRAGDS